MKIIKYEFITPSFPKDEKYIHWSRIYEWKYVVDFLKEKKPKSTHNTACGGLNRDDCLHLTFCNDIDNIVENSIHSDVWGRNNYIGIENKPSGDNFIFYDILTKNDDFFEAVLNISTIEHLPKNKQIIAIQNLLNQVKVGGDLIITFDYPDVDLEQINKFVGQTPNGFNDKIIGKNNLSVVLLHILRE